MKPACLILVLLLFVTGGQGEGGYNEVCAAGDSCDDLSLYCDTSDVNDKKCKCNYGYFAKNSKCVPGAGHPCHHSNCYYTLNCINGECLCDNVTIGYEVASNGATSCACASTKVLQDNKCKLKLDEGGCSTADDCAGDNGVECTGSPLACGCTDADGYQANTAKTECECKSTHHADSDGVCKLKLDEAGCSTAADCTGDNGVECTGSPLACGCSDADGYKANTAKTECECKSTHNADSDGVCKLKLDEAGCSTAADCTGDNGVECTGSPLACGCTDADGYKANTAKTECECKSTHHADSDGVCKLKLDEAGCSTAADCTGDNGVECTGSPLACGCTDADGYKANTAKTECECKSTHHADSDGVCKLKLDEAGCSTAADCTGDNGVECTGSPLACGCTDADGYKANTAKTECECKSTHHADSDGVCKLKLDEAGCSTAADCTGDNGVECTGSPLACGCTDADGYQANTAKTECECKSTHHADSDGVCKLKLDEAGCSTATDCTGNNGVECTGSPLACGCSDADGYQANTAKTECECKSTHKADSDGVCKLKIDQEGCSTADDCTGDTGVECTGSPKTCGCTDADHYQAKSDKTGCECTSDYVMEDGACLLRVGKNCNSSTANCAHGMLCDRKTSTCLCDTHNNYAEGTEGDASCSCDTSVAQSMTYDGKTYCGKKVGGTCTLQSDSDVCYDSTCKSATQTISGNTVDVYGCTCAEDETAGDDGTCSGAGHTAVSMALFIVGIMSSALF